MPRRHDEYALLARFEDQPSARNAMAKVEAAGPPARRVELLPAPTTHEGFDRLRLLFGAVGALGGALFGGIAAGILSAVMNVEAGLIIGGAFGDILTGAVIGALLLGTLGLITGFGIGEAAVPAKLTRRELREGRIPGTVLVRVWLPRGVDAAAVRETLEAAGAMSVGPESHSPWPDERVFQARPVQRRPA